MWGQLQKLRNGIHPKTGKPMPTPTDRGGQPLVEHRRYARLDAKNVALVKPTGDDPIVASNLFTPYVPLPPRELKPYDGRSARVKMQEMALRIRNREMVARKRYRLRGKQKPQDGANVANG
jgi:hypothetical protein